MSTLVKKRILPILLLVCSGIIALSAGGTLFILFQGGGVQPEMIPWGKATILLQLGYALSLSGLCLFLARMAQAYYEGNAGYRLELERFRLATWGFCVLHLVNAVHDIYLSWMINFHEPPPLSAYLSIGVSVVPLVIALILMLDLLTECLDLRDETAMTV